MNIWTFPTYEEAEKCVQKITGIKPSVKHVGKGWHFSVPYAKRIFAECHFSYRKNCWLLRWW